MTLDVDDEVDERPRGRLACALVAAGAAAAVLAGALALSTAVGGRAVVGAAGAASAGAALAVLAWTTVGVVRLGASRRSAAAELEGLVEEISQEFDKLRDRIDALESELARAPAHSPAETVVSVVRR